jgi:hypothetical protein
MTHDHDTQELPVVERVEVSEGALAEFTSEHDFNGIAVRLMVEYGSWVCITASLLPGETRKWTRNQANHRRSFGTKLQAHLGYLGSDLPA